MPLKTPAPMPAIDRRSGLTPVVLPPRHDNLFLLSQYRLEVEGERFPVSPPLKGDQTCTGDTSWKLTFGLAAADVPRLSDFVRHPARLLDREGKELLSFRIERIDRRFKLLIADPRPARD